MKLIKAQFDVIVDGKEYTAQIMVVAPNDTDKDLSVVKSELERLGPDWIKSKIEKG
jgi:hypothetical protein